MTQYREWSDSTLTLKPDSRRLGKIEGETKIKSMRDMAEWDGVKHEKCTNVGHLCLQVSTRMNSERNLPNLVVGGGVATGALGISFPKFGLITILKSPVHIAGTIGCWAIKTTPCCSMVNWY